MDVVHTLEEIYQARTKNTSTSSLNIARKDCSKVDSFDDCQPSLSKHLPLEQEPVPRHGAQISARGCSGTNKTLCSDWYPCPDPGQGYQSEQGLPGSVE